MRSVVSKELSNKFANMSFVCACLVVVIHLTYGLKGWGLWFDSFYRYGIGRMAVPFFFLASGFWLAGKIGCQNNEKRSAWHGYRLELKKRIKALLMPYIFWQLIWLCWMCACVGANAVRTKKSLVNLWPLIGWDNLGLLGLDIWHFPAMGLLWYVRSLIILVLISPLLFIFIRRIGLLGLLALYVLELVGVVWDVPWNVFCNLLPIQSIVYFCAGCYLRDHLPLLNIPKNIASISIVVGVLLCFVKAFCCVILNQTWGGGLVHLAVPLLIVGAWGFIPCAVWPSLFVKNSFPLYLIHAFILGVWGMAFGRDGMNVVMLVLQFVVTMVSSFMLIVFLRKYMPRTATILFGGR